MTTIVYTEGVMSNNSPSSANVTRVVLEIGGGMGESQSAARATITATSSGGHHRPGSPRPKKLHDVRKDKERSKRGGYPSGYPPGFNPRAFTITAYLPNDGGKRLKVYSVSFTS